MAILKEATAETSKMWRNSNLRDDNWSEGAIDGGRHGNIGVLIIYIDISERGSLELHLCIDGMEEWNGKMTR